MNIRLVIEEIKKKLNYQGKNIELVFTFPDELIEKNEASEVRPKIGYRKK